MEGHIKEYGIITENDIIDWRMVSKFYIFNDLYIYIIK
jgi:hypothetical protein